MDGPSVRAGHWVPDLVDAAGAVPLLGESGARSRPLDWRDVATCGADAVIVAPCGFHLEASVAIAEPLEAHADMPKGAALWAIDADAAVVRPGPRLVDGVEALAAVAHPDAVPARPELVRYLGTTSQKTKPSRSTT